MKIRLSETALQQEDVSCPKCRYFTDEEFNEGDDSVWVICKECGNRFEVWL